MKRKSVFFLKKMIAIWSACIMLTMLTGCSRTLQYTATHTAMGTIIQQSIYTSGDDITDEIYNLLTGLEQDTLSWRIADSELARINACAGLEEGIPLSEELESILQVLLEVSKESNGAFDITMHPVVQLWNIDTFALKEEEATLPDENKVKDLLSHTGYEKLKLSKQKLYLPQGMSLDLGAVGKGIACDKVYSFLQEEKVQGAVISIGGSVLTYGEKPDGSAWQVGVADPRDTTSLLGTLTLRGNQFIATSGDYERYVEVDGVRYHHIFDPKTGYPSNNGVCSVTIVGNNGMLCDALSTACFVLGVDKGLDLATKYEMKALFVEESGQIFMTDSMKTIFNEVK